MIISYAAYDTYKQGFQVAMINGGKKLFIRRVYDGALDPTTGNWERLYSTMDKPTAEEVGAISKDGDTMTGDTLGINNGYGKLLSTADLLQLSAYKTAGEAANSNHMQLMQGDASLDSALRLVNYSANGTRTDHNVLHTGNLSANGVAKTESGSYVGTGKNGINHPTEITFGFVPKMVWVWRTAHSPVGDFNGGYCIPCLDLTTEYTKRYFIDTTGNVWWAKLVGTTLSFYYGEEDIDEDTGEIWYPDSSEQLNTKGQTYYYMAIG